MFPLYLKEFMAICNHLESTSCPAAKGYFRIKRSDIEILLDKNRYETSQNKLKAWKALNWISAEERRVTKRIYDGKSKKYLSFVLVDITVYQALKQLASPDQ
jgi:hypothetical protein